MDSIITLISVLTPLFIGFTLRLPKAYLPLIDKGLGWLVYIILLLIGVSLSEVHDLGGRIDDIAGAAALLFVLTIGANLALVMWFDRRHPWQVRSNSRKAHVSVVGSMKQIACVLVGFLIGKALANTWLPPEKTGTYFLMLLIFLVGIQLRSSGITLKQVLVNRRGVQTAALITLSSLLGGVVFSWLWPEVSLSKGLALASGFGWYSLSGIVMTEAYGPIWGSVALLNDLTREFFALMFIPMIMRCHPSAAVGVGGATSMDFTLPVIQSSGGIETVPLAMSFGFIINLIAPILMVFFSTLHF